MIETKFEKLVDKILTECRLCLVKKGNEYSSQVDRFANFKRQASVLSIPKERILQVYLAKHLDSIETYLKTMLHSGVVEANKNLSEPISGRFVDVINYYLLLYAMIDEAQEVNNEEPIN